MLHSGYGFEIVLVKSAVQGDAAPAADRRGDRDPRRRTASTSSASCAAAAPRATWRAFDDERVARAIASCSTPVLTGIGHTGDESVADLVAHTRAITPTKLGEELAAIVESWYARHVRAPAQRVLDATAEVLDEATEYVAERRRTMVFAVRDRLRAEQRHLDSTRAGLARAQPPSPRPRAPRRWRVTGPCSPRTTRSGASPRAGRS